MGQHPVQLDSLFLALADPTRRAVLARLGRGPASVSDLSAPFDMTLPSFLKHIHLLEESGWIQTRKQGRVRTCSLDMQAMAKADAWLSQQRALWEERFDRLDAILEGSDNE